jgi:hypothetical protein
LLEESSQAYSIGNFSSFSVYANSHTG